MEEQTGVIGTAQLRKVTAVYSTIELLKLAAELTENGHDKKLWSLLSRVYQDKKGFTEETFSDTDEVKKYIAVIMNSDMPSEYKMQLYTSFNIPESNKPDIETACGLIETCGKKRSNIAGYFIANYGYENDTYNLALANKDILKVLSKELGADRLAAMYENIILKESKEVITGAVRTLSEFKPRLNYKNKDVIKRVSALVFESKEVFFTTKLLFCLTFDVPSECLPDKRELYKILKISVNYEERITREFVAKYGIDFECNNEAMCRYYIGNKKASNQKLLVSKFANHLVRIEDEEVKRKLLRSAFKRGGYFRMYVGCMQDNGIIVEKLHRFHYSDEDIEWCSNLSGLKK